VPFLRDEAGLLLELSARRDESVFVRIDHTRRKLEARPRSAVAVLTHHHRGAAIRRQRDHARPLRALEQVKLVDLVTVREAHPLLADLEPAALEHQATRQDFPRSKQRHRGPV
jgi:hypothetical protein